ncbi:hypothetical protein B0I37DRAFT_8094 [Chaetomium sp. MPI-CAGE-AT-0009]|nr:hypothetical protein B0I37DRAFT_8094 [Chaetomium sp. MPI-CAGE-AT-0009]
MKVDAPATWSTPRLSEEEWHYVLHDLYYIHSVVFSVPNGDFTLVITGGHSDEVSRNDSDKRIALVVCLGKLDEALPGWRKRIQIQSIIDDPATPQYLPVAEVSRGTPAVFQYLVAAAHHDSSTGDYMIDRHFSLNEVRDMAMLSHRYNAYSLIAGNVPRWVSQYMPPDWELCNDPDQYCGQLEYLWMAYEFLMPRQFYEICYNLVFVTNLTFWNPSSMPPGVYDRIYKRDWPRAP